MRDEIRRAIGIFRVDGKTSLRALQDYIRKILYIDVSLGFIYGELARASQIAERINLRASFLVNLSHCVRDKVWIKMARIREAWNFGFLAVSPKSLFIGFFDYMARRDEVSMGIKVLEHKEKRFGPPLLTSIFCPLTGQFPAILVPVYTSFA